MNTLIIGSGGREHALGWKIKQSPLSDKIYFSPGNGGTSEIGENLDLSVTDFNGIEIAIRKHQISLVLIGPEDPLVNGLVDHLKAIEDYADLLIIGPDANGARLEGSKDYAKSFMEKYQIPTGKAQTFDKSSLDEGLVFLENAEGPYVLKADGLAAGKGVIITENLEAAKNSLKELVNGKFGEASSRVLIEQFLDGIELSVFVLTDGKDYTILPEAKDYKRIGEGDTGLNTGGMGAISPVPFADKSFMNKVETRIVQPTINGIGKEGFDFKGFIFFGLIKVGEDPYVIEYNVRMGDPETEVVMPRIKSDFLTLLVATAKRQLNNVSIEFEDFHTSTVMLVSKGYPEKYEKGKAISIGELKHGTAFHAGTAKKENSLVTNGGRVLALTGIGNSMEEALNNSYKSIKEIKWEGMNFRRDIGFDLKH